MKRVVVTGIGALTPIGNNVVEFKENLFNGKSGAINITRFDASLFKTRFACEVKNFDADLLLGRKIARRVDPFTQYALIVAEEAFQQSGLDLERIDLDRAGVIWGSGIGGFETIEHDISEAALRDGPPRYSPFLIPKLILDIAAGHISIKYGFRGINYATVSACASSTHAISNAFDFIRFGRADIMISGGSEAAVTKASIGGFSSMKALSERNDDPTTASRPFDKDRDGFVLGEGAGALILEEYEHARKRGAIILAEALGIGMTADAYHITAPHPEGLGASNVMKLTLQDAKLNSSDIDYINVHGTSTPLGDISETKAILSVFGKDAYDLNISSTKSMTGHLLGAAGAIEAISCIFAIQDGVVPPTINHFTDDPELDSKLNFTFNQAQRKKVNAAISNTFGFGGHNSSIIFKKFKWLTEISLIRKFYNYYFSKDKVLARRVRSIVGFVPSRLHLYRLAFYHKSMGNTNAKNTYNNERLEYLGDALLSTIVAEYLFKKYPNQNEGFLTKMRSKIVNRRSLNTVAEQMGLDVILSDFSMGRLSRSMMGNALEALVGAIYLEKGYPITKKYVINQILRKHINIHELETIDRNFKSQLLEYCQKNGHSIDYKLVTKYKLEKRDRFKVAVVINGEEAATAEDYNKKSAEQLASELAIHQMLNVGSE